MRLVSSSRRDDSDPKQHAQALLPQPSGQILMLRDDAIEIWKAGVRAVDSERLVRQNLAIDDDCLVVCGNSIPLKTGQKIEVVGAGKAGAGMARGVVAALTESDRPNLTNKLEISGWVNVPEDCVTDCGSIHLHGARPAGINEPTQSGVDGTREILRRVGSLGQDDICMVLISGGGSALLPAPVQQISLADKLNVTQMLAKAGAPIEELNIVRSQLSSVKGGGLLQNCNSGHMVALIISDVTGDPLEYIASGPTVHGTSTAADAIRVLKKYTSTTRPIPRAVDEYLNRIIDQPALPRTKVCQNHIIGSNQVALNAAAEKAVELGYEVDNLGPENCGNAREHGVALAQKLTSIKARQTSGLKTCVLAGGETTVKLADTPVERKGGRNQEVVLGAIADMPSPEQWRDMVVLSGGTDGEDGPTDAAGAYADERIVAEINTCGLRVHDHLAINNSYPILNAVNGLLKTGPTHTNVMDLAVGLHDSTSTGKRD